MNLPEEGVTSSSAAGPGLIPGGADPATEAAVAATRGATAEGSARAASAVMSLLALTWLTEGE